MTFRDSVPCLNINLKIVMNALLFIALGVFAFEPAALKERADHRAEVGLRELKKSAAFLLSSVHGKVEIRKVQGFHTPDLLSVAAHESEIRTRLRSSAAELFTSANFCRLTLRHSLGRGPPAIA